MRTLQLPRVVEECPTTSDMPKNTIFVAYSDMYGKFPVTFQPVKLEDDQRSWPVFQYDRESCRGTCNPRDMIFGFQLISYMPHWKTKGGAQPAYERMTARSWNTEGMSIPPLDTIARLKASSWLQDGMFILLVRMPRPFGSRNVIPMIRRMDIKTLQFELSHNPDNEYASNKLKYLHDKARYDLHPTDAQLFVTTSGTLLQGVSQKIVCTRCQARGHHMSHTHDEVVSSENPAMTSSWPAWMNVHEMPAEVIALPSTETTRGFEVEIRHVKTHVPLRLARQLKLQGIKVEGDVAKCGVMEIDSDASSE